MTEPSGHLDLDALADVLAGERDDAHLRSCGACADRLAELSAAAAPTTAALAALPVPPMPDGLSLRLSRALQEERRRELAVVRPLRRHPPSRRAQSRRTPSWLPVVAASAALVMAGAVGWSLLDVSTGSGQDSATSAAGGAQDTAGEAEESGPASAQDSDTAPEAATGLAAPRTGTATDWADEASRPAALARLLDATDTAATDVPATPSGDVALSRLQDPAALAECLTNLPSGDGDVLAVDYAQYADAPAVAIVQPADPGFVQVTVVGSSCSATDPALLSGVVLPRP